jgi:hypothetical protein
LSDVPAGEGDHVCLDDEVFVEAGRLEADLGLHAVEEHPDPATTGRLVGELEAHHDPPVRKFVAGQVGRGPGPEKEARVRLLVP